MFLRNSQGWMGADDRRHPAASAWHDAAELDDAQPVGSPWKTAGVLLMIALAWIGAILVIAWIFHPGATPRASGTPRSSTLQASNAAYRAVTGARLVPRIPHPIPCAAAPAIDGGLRFDAGNPPGSVSRSVAYRLTPQHGAHCTTGAAPRAVPWHILAGDGWATQVCCGGQAPLRLRSA